MYIVHIIKENLILNSYRSFCMVNYMISFSMYLYSLVQLISRASLSRLGYFGYRSQTKKNHVLTVWTVCCSVPVIPVPRVQVEQVDVQFLSEEGRCLQKALSNDWNLWWHVVRNDHYPRDGLQ